MSPAEVGVVVGAAAAIAWVNWYFFFAGARRGDDAGTER